MRKSRTRAPSIASIRTSRVHQVDHGYICANGPTFSPDGAIVYHTDSTLREIYRFDVRPDGSLGDKRVFARFTEEEGYPDGMTTDREGCLWVAHWGGWRITRFRPDGTRDRVVPMPVSQVTSCTFGGDRLDRMFVTSARIGLTDAQLAKEPLAGGLFEIDPGTTGLPTPAIRGIAVAALVYFVQERPRCWFLRQTALPALPRKASRQPDSPGNRACATACRRWHRSCFDRPGQRSGHP